MRLPGVAPTRAGKLRAVCKVEPCSGRELEEGSHADASIHILEHEAVAVWPNHDTKPAANVVDVVPASQLGSSESKQYFSVAFLDSPRSSSFSAVGRLLMSISDLKHFLRAATTLMERESVEAEVCRPGRFGDRTDQCDTSSTRGSAFLLPPSSRSASLHPPGLPPSRGNHPRSTPSWQSSYRNPYPDRGEMLLATRIGSVVPTTSCSFFRDDRPLTWSHGVDDGGNSTDRRDLGGKAD